MTEEIEIAHCNDAFINQLIGNEDDLVKLISIGDDPICLGENDMAWVILVLAGMFEVGWAVGLKYTEGFSRFWPTLGTVLAIIVSLWLLGIAMKSLPVGTAYSVWVGVGIVGTVILGIMLFEEPANAMRLVSVGLIVAGIIGLKLT